MKELQPYMGPIHLGSQDGLNIRTIRVGMAYAEDALTGSSGEHDKLFSDGNLFNCDAWTQYSAEYSEFRVVAWQVKYLPKYYNNNSPSGVVGNSAVLGAWAPYHENNISPTNVNAVLSNPGHKVYHSGRPNVMEVRHRGVEELAWKPCVAGTLPGLSCIKLYATGGDPETSYGLWYNEFVVEFRSRR